MRTQISITGDLASGKSTLSKNLGQKLGIDPIFVGPLVRQIAEDNHMSILEANVAANKDFAKSAWMDQQVDDAVRMKIQSLDAAGEDYIIDARVGFYTAPASLKIKLMAHLEIAAERVFAEKRKNEQYTSVKDAYDALYLRHHLERDRFINRYGIDIDDLSNYDLVIDTSFIQPEHTAQIVEKVLKAREDGKYFPKFWCHPGQIIPGGQTSGQFEEKRAQEMIDVISRGEFDFLRSIEIIRSPSNDLLLEDGHHRTVAACVTSLPYIGSYLKEQNDLPDMRQFASRMYDYYEAMNYMARLYLEKHPGNVPYWGEYKEGDNDPALNHYKFGFAQRAFGLPVPEFQPK